MYEFMRNGYISYFFPRVVNYGRIHENQRGERLSSIELPARKRYIQDIKSLRISRNFIFKDSNNQIIKKISWYFSIYLWLPFIFQLIIRSKILTYSPLKIIAFSKKIFFKRDIK